MGNVVPFGNPIGPKVLKWFQNRKISEKTLINTGVYSKPHHPSGGELIVFPFVVDGKIINEKYRDHQKKIWQSGGEQVFWNADVLHHPDLQSGKCSLVITEGEIDALSFIEAGYPFVVSVPNGAPPPKEELDISEEDTGFLYIKRFWKVLKGIKRIILATDTDPPGQFLKKNLAFRLGEARCFIPSYPVGCKDANDALVLYGPEAVLQLVSEASPYPIAGLYKSSNLPPEPAIEPLTTGWGRLDEFFMPCAPAFMVVTGKPNEGKSTWTTQLAAQMAIHHNWNIAIASFEGMVRPFITSQLQAVYSELVPQGNPDQWLFDHFNFIIARGDEEDDTFDLDWLLDRAIAAWVRFGIKMLIIDPWNELEHSFGKNETQTDYIGRAIRRLKRFTYERGVLVLVVAHPTKGASDKKKSEEIELFDIADSAHWHNKADFGLTVARVEGSYLTNVYIRKVRHQPRFGKRGMVGFVFDPYYGTFSQ